MGHCCLAPAEAEVPGVVCKTLDGETMPGSALSFNKLLRGAVKVSRCFYWILQIFQSSNDLELRALESVSSIDLDESRAVWFFALFVRPFAGSTHEYFFFSPGLLRGCFRVDSKM